MTHSPARGNVSAHIFFPPFSLLVKSSSKNSDRKSTEGYSHWTVLGDTAVVSNPIVHVVPASNSATTETRPLNDPVRAPSTQTLPCPGRMAYLREQFSSAGVSQRTTHFSSSHGATGLTVNMRPRGSDFV